MSGSFAPYFFFFRGKCAYYTYVSCISVCGWWTTTQVDEHTHERERELASLFPYTRLARGWGEAKAGRMRTFGRAEPEREVGRWSNRFFFPTNFFFLLLFPPFFFPRLFFFRSLFFLLFSVIRLFFGKKIFYEKEFTTNRSALLSARLLLAPSRSFCFLSSNFFHFFCRIIFSLLV